MTWQERYSHSVGKELVAACLAILAIEYTSSVSALMVNNVEGPARTDVELMHLERGK